MRQVIAALFISVWPASAGVLEQSRQCIVVTTSSWSSTKGTMSIFERDRVNQSWRNMRSGVSVVVGNRGMAWAESRVFVMPTDEKREGDHMAPAGIFSVQSVFGYAANAKTKMPYVQVTPDIVCVDDPKSRHYNEVVDKRKIDVDWRSAEEMRRRDIRYKWGIMIDHNIPPQRGAGSCIFLHVWIAPNVPTVGCTAMAEKDIVDLIGWLDPTKNPMLIQMPRKVYDIFCDEWNLPALR